MSTIVLLRRFAKLKPTPELYAEVRQAFFNVFCDQTLVPLYIRLGFHDAGTFDKSDKSGGPHGSIRFKKQLAHPENKGLERGIPSLETLKLQFPQVSYADLIQAGVAAAVEYANGPKIPFNFGRTDAKSDSEVPPQGRIPSPSDNLSQLRTTFGRMSLNDVDLVVLSGAHTVGKDHFINKPWTKDNKIFNNHYFIELLKKDADPSLVRLDSDVALLSTDETKDIVRRFAKDENEFLRQYAVSQQKLSELGNCLE